jgi:signal transduction histidine kinase
LRPGPSLRLRLLVGAGLIAALAAVAAGLTVWGNARTAELIAAASAAQQRIDLLGRLSARVGDYALVALEGAGAGLAAPERSERLAGRAEPVRAAFAAVEASRARAGEAPGLGLARMRASFETLARAAPDTADLPALRARLDSFATLFAPLLDEAIEAERRAAREAEASLDRQGRLMWTLALAIALGAAGLLAAFHLVLVRPLLGRLDRVSRAAEAVGAGAFRPVAVDRRDELGLVFARINRMAARLARGRRALERDRARLEATVTARTAELSTANARLEATDAERRRLFADVGHELRTPLTVILAETDLAARPGADEPELRAALAVISARARRLNRRIDDLLRVARSESGELELDAGPFDLAAAAADAIDDIAPLARRARVALAPRLAPAVALGDCDWSRQVIAGVLDNAVRHSPPGTSVEVAVTAAGAKIAVTVTDQGEGVPEADLERIFTRHVRGARRGLGFGVGLALARWVMTRQGGAIALDSPGPGRGTRVTLSFPAAP